MVPRGRDIQYNDREYLTFCLISFVLKKIIKQIAVWHDFVRVKANVSNYELQTLAFA